MRVRMKVALSGLRNGVRWPVQGEEIDVPDAEGADLCRIGLAEPVAQLEQTETATPPAAEKRATKPRKPRTPRS